MSDKEKTIAQLKIENKELNEELAHFKALLGQLHVANKTKLTALGLETAAPFGIEFQWRVFLPPNGQGRDRYKLQAKVGILEELNEPMKDVVLVENGACGPLGGFDGGEASLRFYENRISDKEKEFTFLFATPGAQGSGRFRFEKSKFPFAFAINSIMTTGLFREPERDSKFGGPAIEDSSGNLRLLALTGHAEPGQPNTLELWIETM